MNNYLLILFALIMAACNSSARKNEQPKPKTFVGKEIGWTIIIPDGYQSISQNRVQANEQKGKEAIENASGEKVEINGLIHLINFQKNQFNSFQATIQPYSEKQNGNYNESNELTKKAVYDAYTAQKIKVDTSSYQKIYAGKSFAAFAINIYGPNGNIIMKQVMLSRLVKGYDFGITINANNNGDEKILFDALENSKFSN
jgi:hypothetical protein